MEIAQHRLTTLVAQRIEQGGERVRSMKKLLESLGPDAVLARGFSLTTDADGRTITDAEKVRAGDKLITRLAKGSVTSTATK
jgi:exodeoxyribonuclease VII large subunit